ncbi:hypothetical protein [Streptomyces sp. GS7]|uniref:hypothetical protein n=1 Tax=Streptomyces sp. GS7 TaxID=2692234 RepID=UPI0013165685|nr:hypothetical protein [Streptomyces sp. GS7]QHC22741.1 hypothetical protein GR130_16185 [Streptomyces sp. GS7]
MTLGDVGMLAKKSGMWPVIAAVSVAPVLAIAAGTGAVNAVDRSSPTLSATVQSAAFLAPTCTQPPCPSGIEPPQPGEGQYNSRGGQGTYGGSAVHHRHSWSGEEHNSDSEHPRFNRHRNYNVNPAPDEPLSNLNRNVNINRNININP